MTVALIILASALALAVGGLIALGLAYRTQGAKLLAESLRGDELQRERDTADFARSAAEARNAEYERRLAATEIQRNDAIAKEATRVETQVRDGGAAAVDRFNDVLSPHASAAGGAPDRPVTDGGDHGGAPAVSSTAGADPYATRR